MTPREVSEEQQVRFTLIGLALVVIALPVWLAIIKAGIAYTHDGMLHYIRLIGLDHAVSVGLNWPRIAPGLAFGYGYPVFSYYSPLSIYPAEWLHLAGLSLIEGFIGNGIIATACGVVGAFMLGRLWSDDLGGFATAAGFLYSPYYLGNWFWRGAIGEFWALSLVSWVLWAFSRVYHQPQRREAIIAAASLALLIVMHNITALAATLLLVICCLAFVISAEDKRRTFLWLIAGGIGGLALASFFWMPALLEKDFVQIGLTVQPGTLIFSNHFMALSDLFLPTHAADVRQLMLSLPLPVFINTTILLLTLIGLIAFVVRFRHIGKRVKILVAAFTLMLAMLVFLALPASEPLWETIPLMQFIQFPWRLAGFVGILLSVSAGVAVSVLVKAVRQTPVKVSFAYIAIAALMIPGLSWTYGQELLEIPGDNLQYSLRYEIDQGRIGGTAMGEYLPSQVRDLPDVERLLPRFSEKAIIARLHPDPAITLMSERWESLSAELSLKADDDTMLVFDWFYFPGWQVTIDGVPRKVEATDPEGLLTITVPSGDHVVNIWFGDTPLRTVARAISVVALLVMATAVFVPDRPLIDWLSREKSYLSHWPVTGAVILSASVILIVKLAYVDQTDNLLRPDRFSDGYTTLQHPVFASVNDQIILLGAEMTAEKIPADVPVEMVLFWQLKDTAIAEDYASLLQVKDSAGQVIAETLSYYPQGVPTSVWIPGYFVAESVSLSLPAGTPPGVYTIEAGMFDPERMQQLPVRNAGDMPVGVTIEVASITVARPETPVNLASLPVEQTIASEGTGPLRLISMSSLPRDAMSGDLFAFDWYWLAEEEPGGAYSASIAWLDDTGEVAGVVEIPELAAGAPTASWEAGDIIRGVHEGYVPGSLHAGLYQVVVELVEEQSGESRDSFPVGEMQVREPDRSFTAIPFEITVNSLWNNGISLLGLSRSGENLTPGEDLSLTLIWQTTEPITRNLLVFAHLVDDEGIIITQSDGIPAGGIRPFTGWMVGEYISDTVLLDLPTDLAEGTYGLRLGIYDPLTGERIAIDGQEYLWLENLFTNP